MDLLDIDNLIETNFVLAGSTDPFFNFPVPHYIKITDLHQSV